MAVSGQGFSTFVANMVSAARASAQVALDTSVGSIALALIQAVAGACLWLQALVLQVLAQSRASTSQGTDLDSWCADYGFVRLTATFAEGQATFARFQTTNQAIIPVGALIATQVGGVQFAVTADPTNPAYSANALGAGQGGFVIPAGTNSLAVLATAVVAGSAGNIVPGSLAAILQPISQVDTVTNLSSFGGGADPESDAAFRARFQAFILQLFKSTRAAIVFAAQSVQPGLTVQVLENQTFAGATAPGGFIVIVDDGSGAPPPGLLSAVGGAIDAARALGVTFSVIGPTIVTANVSMTLTSIDTTQHAADITAAKTALTVFLNAVPLGSGLAYSRLAQIVYDASSNISNVTAVTLNGGTADIAGVVDKVVKAGTVVVS
ncbi:MAG TPA: baseplate J/gp47 family protein [Aliidongia sp.]|nr:baseplate J/gp47 family protein [Aliidongia sp.]